MSGPRASRRRLIRFVSLVTLTPALVGLPSAADEPPERRPIPVRLTAAGQILGRWIGQDRHDYCGAPDAIKPNGYQDVHIALGGLPPGREVVAAWVYGHGG